MAVTLLVEDGTGQPHANALIGVQHAKAVWAASGRATRKSDAAIADAIIRASAHLSNGWPWRGCRVRGRHHAGGGQALSWPRVGAGTPDNLVPIRARHACAELAWHEVNHAGGLDPVYTPPADMRTLRAAPAGGTYHATISEPPQARPVLLRVAKILDGLLQ